MNHEDMAAELRREGWHLEPPPRQESEATRAECAAQQQQRAAREQGEIAQARASGQSRSYIDTDGCEVTVTPSGHTFYNAADWY